MDRKKFSLPNADGSVTRIQLNQVDRRGGVANCPPTDDYTTVIPFHASRSDPPSPFKPYCHGRTMLDDLKF